MRREDNGCDRKGALILPADATRRVELDGLANSRRPRPRRPRRRAPLLPRAPAARVAPLARRGGPDAAIAHDRVPRRDALVARPLPFDGRAAGDVAGDDARRAALREKLSAAALLSPEMRAMAPQHAPSAMARARRRRGGRRRRTAPATPRCRRCATRCPRGARAPTRCARRATRSSRATPKRRAHAKSALRDLRATGGAGQRQARSFEKSVEEIRYNRFFLDASAVTIARPPVDHHRAPPTALARIPWKLEESIWAPRKESCRCSRLLRYRRGGCPRDRSRLARGAQGVEARGVHQQGGRRRQRRRARGGGRGAGCLRRPPPARLWSLRLLRGGGRVG